MLHELNRKGNFNFLCGLHGQNKQPCMPARRQNVSIQHQTRIGNMILLLKKLLKLLLQNISLRTTCKMEFEIAQEIADLTKYLWCAS